MTTVVRQHPLKQQRLILNRGNLVRVGRLAALFVRTNPGARGGSASGLPSSYESRVSVTPVRPLALKGGRVLSGVSGNQ